jgi:uncharacterized protein YbbC (DUF1343 family)
MLISLLLFQGCDRTDPVAPDYEHRIVLTGLDVLKIQDFSVLEGKRVGLITNATGVNSRLRSGIDIFYEADSFQLTALFGPEHGVRGDYPAGGYVPSYTDRKTGLPVFSLYGPTRRPTPEMLENIDVLVFDIQDIGVRSYTYISTMGLAMEAAAENDLEMIILDRPNPLGGDRVEGSLVQDGYISFISPYRIPYVHGLTVGELALMLNTEGMLANGARCNLSVVPMKNWTRDMTFNDTELTWVPTSPHIPHAHTAFYYPASGIMGELQVVSEGVGYTLPFELWGASWVDPHEAAAEMNALGLPSVTFRPASWKPFYGRDKGKTLHGVQVHIADPGDQDLNLMSLQFIFMEVLNRLYPRHNPLTRAEPDRLRMFDLAAGSSHVRELFSENMRYEDIKDYLEKDVLEFRQNSEKYHLYGSAAR